jgi:hypothetical protein
MKKIKVLLSLAFTIIIYVNINAQICNTLSPEPPPWLFNSALQSTQSISATYTLCVFVHIVRSSSGNGLGSGIVNTLVSKLNSDYANTGIQFQSIGNDFINNDVFYSNLATSEYAALYATNSHTNAIDIYVLGISTNTGNTLGVAASIPSTALWVHGNYYNTSVLSHEMGHCLGLYHTHHGTVTESGGDPLQCKELVNGSNSSFCGDYVTDTPADPNFWNGCNYNGTVKDDNNQSYNPNPSNYMSYSSYTCWSLFTTVQKERMKDFIANTTILQNVIYNPPPTISGASSLYSFQQSTYTINNLPANTTVTWSGSSNVNIISGQGTSQVTVSICSGETATLTATLSGNTINDAVSKQISLYQPEIALKLENGIATFSTGYSYAQCYDWYAGSDFHNGGQFNCSGSSINLYPLSGHTTGVVSVRAKSNNCYTVWQEKTFYLWTPEIGTGYYNPLRPEPFYANLVENIPNYASHSDVRFYWYFDNTLLDITYEPYIESHDWPCGEHQLKVVAYYDGNTESHSSSVDFWGMCRSRSGLSSYSAAYPNPAGNELIIDRETNDDDITANTLDNKQSTKAKDNATVKVLLYSHSTTQLVYTKDFPASAQQIRIDTSKLPNGIYYLNIIANSEKIKQQTIIVNH